MRRRDFLQMPALAAVSPGGRKRLAALSSTYHVRSHSDNVITRVLEGYWIGERFHEPSCEIAALWMDQIHRADIGRRLAAAYGFEVRRSIADAVTLGTGSLAVDGVILVCEHGDYPHNEKNQQLYPRFEFFEQVVAVFRASGRAAPVFVDKHLSYDWAKAKRMYDWSRELRFPLLAGSSLPVTFRRPDLDYPLGVELEGAVMVGGGWVGDGGVFHNLETLQVFVERRRGGETGIRAVRQVSGDEVWRLDWPRELMHAALRRGERVGPGRPEDAKNPRLCVLEYADGFRGYVIMLPGLVNEYLVALQVKGRPRPDATLCYIPGENSNNFSMLVHGALEMMSTGRAPYPVERTLLTTGALAALMESAWLGGKRIETPHLDIRYTAPRESFYAKGAGS